MQRPGYESSARYDLEPVRRRKEMVVRAAYDISERVRGDVVISVRRLWKVYGRGEATARAAIARGHAAEGDGIALRDVSLDVCRGELLVVMGLSGSGKSTLVRCLNGLVVPTAGTVRVLGTDLLGSTGPELRRLRPRVGMIFQSFGLLPYRTVLSNVGFGLELRNVPRAEREQRSQEMLALVGLHGRQDAYPHELSGGQQQRVGLARALALDPDILLMDEPFSSLDALIREDLRCEIRALQARLHKTIVLITHDLTDAVALADRIAMLHDGRLLQVGTPAEICFSPADEIVERFVRHVDRLEAVPVEQAIDGDAGQRPARTILASAPLAEAVRLLGNPEVDALLAVDGHGRELGVVTASSVLCAMMAQAPARSTEGAR
jgi:glycine betaine/proline transport system ATP-binding protein